MQIKEPGAPRQDRFKSSERITFGIYRSIKGLSTGEVGHAAPQAEKFRVESVFIGRNVRDKPDFFQSKEQICNIGSVRRGPRSLAKES